jgi:hypothetical protein
MSESDMKIAILPCDNRKKARVIIGKMIRVNRTIESCGCGTSAVIWV